MTIEANLVELNATLRALIGALEERIPLATPATVPERKSDAKPLPKPAPKLEPVPGVEEAMTALSYEKDVKPLALKAIAKDKVAYVAIVQKLGAKNATEVKPEQYATFVEALKGIVA